MAKKSELLGIASSAYQMLYILENLLRKKIHTILVAEIGEDYLVNPNLVNQRNIQLLDIASRLKDQDIVDRIPESQNLPPLYYLELWHLGKVIEVYWNCFSGFFPGRYTLDQIKTRFSMLSPIRNRIAHTKNIRATDRDALKEMLDYFSRFFEGLTVEMVLTEFTIEPEPEGDAFTAGLLGEIKTALSNHSALPKNWMLAFTATKISSMEHTTSEEDLKLLAERLTEYQNYVGVPRGSERMREISETNQLVDKVTKVMGQKG